MLLLFESSAGYALFKVLKDGSIEKADVRVGLATQRSEGAATGGGGGGPLALAAACACSFPPVRGHAHAHARFHLTMTQTHRT